MVHDGYFIGSQTLHWELASFLCKADRGSVRSGLATVATTNTKRRQGRVLALRRSACLAGCGPPYPFYTAWRKISGSFEDVANRFFVLPGRCFLKFVVQDKSLPRLAMESCFIKNWNWPCFLGVHEVQQIKYYCWIHHQQNNFSKIRVELHHLRQCVQEVWRRRFVQCHSFSDSQRVIGP